jgi:hypothetical protein
MTALAVLEHEAKAVARRLAYQAQDCRLTLAEGLAEYYAANAGRVTPPEDLTEASAALFRWHDICHVIFGLDTTFADEAMADTRAMLATDVGWRTYMDYLRSNPDAQAIFKEIGLLRVVWPTILAVPRLLAAFVEAGRIRKKWPWLTPDSLRERRLGDLRAEFGIKVI